jgi:hypothetical protein
MSQDITTVKEAALVGCQTGAGDHQHWSCHTKVQKLWIPDGIKRSLADELIELERMGTVYGVDLVRDGGVMRSIGELQMERLLKYGLEPEELEVAGNLLMYGGASNQWQTLIGNGTTTAGQSLTYFSNAQAAIGVGDSTTAAAATQTDLQAATNKLRVAMDATYPTHTDGTTSGSASISYRSTFSTAQANWAWQEWGVFNSATAGTGRMLQRKVESLGTKTSASTWALTVTLTLA